VKSSVRYDATRYSSLKTVTVIANVDCACTKCHKTLGPGELDLTHKSFPWFHMYSTGADEAGMHIFLSINLWRILRIQCNFWMPTPAMIAVYQNLN